MKITYDMIKNGCENQVKIFQRTWPNGVEVTVENCLIAVELGLNLDWAATHLFSAPAGEQYKKEIALAGEKYEKVEALEWEQYGKVESLAWEQY